eukprot:99318-Rhodomonas_salina.1
MAQPALLLSELCERAVLAGLTWASDSNGQSTHINTRADLWRAAACGRAQQRIQRPGRCVATQC